MQLRNPLDFFSASATADFVKESFLAPAKIMAKIMEFSISHFRKSQAEKKNFVK